MKKLIFSFLLAASCYSLIAIQTSASQVCQPLYGGGQTCAQEGNVLINKKVLNPKTFVFVDNLSSNDPQFSPNQDVLFELSIANTSNVPVSRLTVKDVFPKEVFFTNGPGVFDTKSKILSFEIADLAANETRTLKVSGKVVPQEQLPEDQNITCVTNIATVGLPGGKDILGQDNAQFCIQKQITLKPTVSQAPGVIVTPTPQLTKGGLKVFPPVKTKKTPPTGPEVLALVGLIPTGALGYFLRKKSS